MVTEDQLQQWEREHQERIDRLTNLNGPECRDCSPANPCQVAALLASVRTLLRQAQDERARLGEAEEREQRTQGWLDRFQGEVSTQTVRAIRAEQRLAKYGHHLRDCPKYLQPFQEHLACSCGFEALAPGAGGTGREG